MESSNPQDDDKTKNKRQEWSKTLRQYHIYLDKYNHDPRIADLFTPDGIFILKGANFNTESKGHDEIAKAFKDVKDLTVQCTHLLGNKRFKDNKVYHTVMAIEEKKDGTIFHCTGKYIIEMDKDSDKIKYLEINVLLFYEIKDNNKKVAQQWLFDTHNGNYAWFDEKDE